MNLNVMTLRSYILFVDVNIVLGKTNYIQLAVK